MRKKMLAGISAIALVSSMAFTPVATAGTTHTPGSDAEGHWAEAALLKLKAEHTMTGFPDGTLRPDSKTTRAEAIVMLNQIYSFTPTGNTVFTDVPDWAKSAADDAGALGIVKGMGEGKYAPHQTLSRAEAVVMIAKAVTGGNIPAVSDEVLLPYSDGAAIPSWAKDAFAFAVTKGIVQGTPDKYLLPNAPMTRAQFATAVVAAEKAFPIVSILGTNEIHGALLPGKDKYANDRSWGGADIFAAYVQREREKNPNGVVLLESGDAMQGTALSNVNKGKPVVEALSAIGFDASAIGNHEWDWGREEFFKRQNQAKFTYLAANIFDSQTGKRPDWAQPYKIVEKNGLKIAIVGVSPINTPEVTLKANVEGLTFINEAEAVNQLVPELRQQADLIVVTAHVGGFQDSKTGEITGDIANMASKLHGVDAIVGGHIPNFVNGAVNGIPIVMGFKSLYAYGEINLVVDAATKQVSARYTHVEKTYGDAVQSDAAVKKIIDDYNTSVQAIMSEVLAKSDERIDRSGRGQSLMGNLIADIIREKAGTQIAFQNSGGLRTDWDAGNITLGMVYEVMPFDNTIYTMKLTAQQVKETLEARVDRATGQDPDNQTSGMKFIWDPIAEKGRKIKSISLLDGTSLYKVENGKDIFAEGTFTVATNNFMATGGDGFDALKNGQESTDTFILIREAINDYLREQGKKGITIHPVLDDRATPISQ